VKKVGFKPGVKEKEGVMNNNSGEMMEEEELPVQSMKS